MSVQYVKDSEITGHRSEPLPKRKKDYPLYSSYSSSAKMMPTRHWLKIGNKWHRVYMVRYIGGTAKVFILKGGKRLFLREGQVGG